MAITLATDGRNLCADGLGDNLDSGTIELHTAGDVEVATLTLNAAAFPAAATGTITAAAISDDASATGGTTTKFVLKDSGSNTIMSGTVTASGGGGDIILDNTTIGAGVTVSITSLTITVPAT